MATESQLPYRQVNICASLEMTTKWILARHPKCSTIVESSLQISLFMQNKANFRKSQVNVRPLVIMNYERKSDWTPGENKPNSKPIKANFKGKKMLLGLTINGRRESFRYYADEIEAAKACDRVAKKYRVWPRFFAGGKLDTEINFSLWPDKKSGDGFISAWWSMWRIFS